MNSDQLKGQIRTWLLGGLAAVLAWFAGKGYISQDAATTILSSPLLGAFLLFIANAAWSWFDKTDTAMIAKVDALAKKPDTGVKAVITDDTPKGIAIANNLPGRTTVPAGTVEAQIAAKGTL